jgi:methylated-DNA-protein-cysteine methyltransferase-like protein
MTAHRGKGRAVVYDSLLYGMMSNIWPGLTPELMAQRYWREGNTMSTTLYNRIYEVVRHIPPGRVATYGQVATVVGPPLTAREVGEAMAALRDVQTEPPVPWQRVINAQGKVSTGPRQQHLLEQEGVVFNAKGYTDLRRYSWQGPDPAWATAHGFQVLSTAASEKQLNMF